MFRSQSYPVLNKRLCLVTLKQSNFYPLQMDWHVHHISCHFAVLTSARFTQQVISSLPCICVSLAILPDYVADYEFFHVSLPTLT